MNILLAYVAIAFGVTAALTLAYWDQFDAQDRATAFAISALIVTLHRLLSTL
ncbi:hypothetical protein [Sagittula sp. P11]|uniref:hypothetical protein n=1 Tax=Sagittula sp. P11 TaxID=2009329 RepID=UPI0012FD73FA|nr:hypothetical protein [Sagittula sp. P11]